MGFYVEVVGDCLDVELYESCLKMMAKDKPLELLVLCSHFNFGHLNRAWIKYGS